MEAFILLTAWILFLSGLSLTTHYFFEKLLNFLKVKNSYLQNSTAEIVFESALF